MINEAIEMLEARAVEHEKMAAAYQEDAHKRMTLHDVYLKKAMVMRACIECLKDNIPS